MKPDNYIGREILAAILLLHFTSFKYLHLKTPPTPYALFQPSAN